MLYLKIISLVKNLKLINQEELKDWAEDLIEENKIIKQGFLNHKNVRKIWESHISGNADYTARIWSILMFQSWLEHNS